ncbi:MAG TPA: hypothetical protein VH137_01090 [Gemmatimonadales bacterium]|nr:hypothetical protein [Gemmatimonadales bacterium]
MNLKDAFPRPTGEETESALQALALRVRARPNVGAGRLRRVAAVVAGLAAAYGVGFAAGKAAPREPQPPTVQTGPGEAPLVVRPPVLVAGPRS